MHVYLRAAGYGFATGLRTLSAPAALNGSRGLGRLLIVAAIGELVADKLPFVPSRLEAPALLGRFIAGGYAGWRVSDDGSKVFAMASGAVGAVAGAVIGYRSRRYIVERLGVPALLVALAEDALVIGIIASLYRPRD